MSVSNTFHAWLYNLCCFMVLRYNFYSSAVELMELKITETVAFILWFTVSFQALRRRRAMQRLTRREYLRFLRHKTFRFRQAQRFSIALVLLSFCYFTRTCGVLRPRTIWALASSPHPSAILNVFGLIMVETTSRGCFNHTQNNYVSTMIRAIHCLI